MKKSLFLSLLITAFCINVQGQISFPQDFKLDPRLLNGMVIAEIPEEFHSLGLHENPAATDNKDAISAFSDIDNENILQIYYEIYRGEGDEHDDAGVIVSEFSSEGALLNNLYQLRNQSNLAYLIKDNYLIEVWSDDSRNSQEQIDSMVNYYLNKLQAEVYESEEEDLYETEVATEAAGYAEPSEIMIVEEGIQEGTEEGIQEAAE